MRYFSSVFLLMGVVTSSASASDLSEKAIDVEYKTKEIRGLSSTPPTDASPIGRTLKKLEANNCHTLTAAINRGQADAITVQQCAAIQDEFFVLWSSLPAKLEAIKKGISGMGTLGDQRADDLHQRGVQQGCLSLDRQKIGSGTTPESTLNACQSLTNDGCELVTDALKDIQNTWEKCHARDRASCIAGVGYTHLNQCLIKSACGIGWKEDLKYLAGHNLIIKNKWIKRSEVLPNCSDSFDSRMSRAKKPGHGASRTNQQPIKSVIQKKKGQVQYCYEQCLQDNPKMAGLLSVKMKVNSGRVTSVTFTENTTSETSIESCVTGKARRWRFPPGVTAAFVMHFNLNQSADQEGSRSELLRLEFSE